MFIWSSSAAESSPPCGFAENKSTNPLDLALPPICVALYSKQPARLCGEVPWKAVLRDLTTPTPSSGGTGAFSSVRGSNAVSWVPGAGGRKLVLPPTIFAPAGLGSDSLEGFCPFISSSSPHRRLPPMQENMGETASFGHTRVFEHRGHPQDLESFMGCSS